MNFEKIKRLSLDLYKGNVKEFENAEGKMVDANEAMRQLILEKCNGEFTQRAFKKYQNDIFEILEVALTQATALATKDIFEPMMVWKDTALGEKPEFTVDNGELFEVSVVADGTTNLYRQRLHNRKVQTRAFNLGVKIYEEMVAFVTGRVDWTALVDRVAKSMDKKVAELIGKTFATAYTPVLAGNLKVQATMDEGKLLELAEKVGSGAVIYGTKLALSKIPGIQGFATDATDTRNAGYVRMFRGVKCVELENTYDANSNTFMLPNDKLFIVPEGDKCIYGGYEGDAIIDETAVGERYDLQVEFAMIRRLHLGVAVANRFGVYEIQ